MTAAPPPRCRSPGNPESPRSPAHAAPHAVAGGGCCSAPVFPSAAESSLRHLDAAAATSGARSGRGRRHPRRRGSSGLHRAGAPVSTATCHLCRPLSCAAGTVAASPAAVAARRGSTPPAGGLGGAPPWRPTASRSSCSSGWWGALQPEARRTPRGCRAAERRPRPWASGRASACPLPRTAVLRGRPGHGWASPRTIHGTHCSTFRRRVHVEIAAPASALAQGPSLHSAEGLVRAEERPSTTQAPV